MSLLGFDAVGWLALGGFSKPGYAILPGIAGACAVTGRPATLNATASADGTNYAVSGNAVLFRPSLSLAASAFVEVGGATGFSTSCFASAASDVINGGAALFGWRLPTGAVSYALNGNAAPLLASLGTESAGYVMSGFPARLMRDFINWFPFGVPTGAWLPKSSSPSATAAASFSSDGGVDFLGVGCRRAAGAWRSHDVPVTPWIVQSEPENIWLPKAAPPTSWTPDAVQSVPSSTSS